MRLLWADSQLAGAACVLRSGLRTFIPVSFMSWGRAVECAMDAKFAPGCRHSVNVGRMVRNTLPNSDAVITWCYESAVTAWLNASLRERSGIQNTSIIQRSLTVADVSHRPQMCCCGS